MDYTDEYKVNIFKIVIFKLLSFLNSKTEELVNSATKPSFKGLLLKNLKTSIIEKTDPKVIDADKRALVKNFISK